MQIACYSCQILMKLIFYRQIFETYLCVRFHANICSESQVVACGQTDKQTDMANLIVAFPNFAYANKSKRTSI